MLAVGLVPGLLLGDRGTGVGCSVRLWDFGSLWVLFSCPFSMGALVIGPWVVLFPVLAFVYGGPGVLGHGAGFSLGLLGSNNEQTNTSVGTSWCCLVFAFPK